MRIAHKKSAFQKAHHPITKVQKGVRGQTAAQVISYRDADFFLETDSGKELHHLNDPIADKGMVRWVKVEGLGDTAAIERICEDFGIHALVVDDLLSPTHRPKIEIYENYVYIVATIIDMQNSGPIYQQLNLIFGNDYVLSFEETKGDVFDHIIDKIKISGSRIRKNGADYLVYSMLDTIIDGYFDVLDILGEHIDEAENELLSSPSMDDLNNMRRMKRDLIYIHKSVWPLREVVARMERDAGTLIADATQPYIRDAYSHIIQIIDTTETYRELLSGLMDLYLSMVSNKMNEIMKVLTIISTIFIPLTFIAGVYGMNFDFMPELRWPWGYGFSLLLMAGISGMMIGYFKRRKWF